ncbi:hypothetical protein [Umezawaea beigongshangensis]|uniref:hypothetical protein n=1 Tax=Umezawaea beigongshangensis TaxID=2780383 RepID=UPI001E60BDE1|nr:hypothetical protein [Umezawaea beigongshangensis]
MTHSSTVETTAPSSQRTVLRDLVASYSRAASPRTITIVGNAPMAPDAARAAVVDGSDLVVRATSFALDRPGDRPTLGSRCDVVVLHRGVIPSPFTFAGYRRRMYLVVEPGRLHWEPEAIPHWWPRDLGFVPVPNYEFTVPLLDLLGLDREEAVWSTTGTLAAFVFTELFPDATVRLTGTSIVDDPDQTIFQHAWGDPVRVTAEHRLHAESALLRQWDAQGRIRLLS